MPSLKSMKIPKERNKAQMSAIYKKGDRKLSSNYRPIGLTSILCKCMEGIVLDLMKRAFGLMKSALKKSHAMTDYIVPEWNDFVKQKHTIAREAYIAWHNASKPRYGYEYEQLKITHASLSMLSYSVCQMKTRLKLTR